MFSVIGSALSAFGTGFAIGFSLIMAIGAQNAFVLRQGLMRRHVFAVALFCAVSDALLIAIGVSGSSVLISKFGTWIHIMKNQIVMLSRNTWNENLVHVIEDTGGVK